MPLHRKKKIRPIFSWKFVTSSCKTNCFLQAFEYHRKPDTDAKTMAERLVFFRKFSVILISKHYSAQLLVMHTHCILTWHWFFRLDPNASFHKRINFGDLSGMQCHQRLTQFFAHFLRHIPSIKRQNTFLGVVFRCANAPLWPSVGRSVGRSVT